VLRQAFAGQIGRRDAVCPTTGGRLGFAGPMAGTLAAVKSGRTSMQGVADAVLVVGV